MLIVKLKSLYLKTTSINHPSHGNNMSFLTTNQLRVTLILEINTNGLMIYFFKETD